MSKCECSKIDYFLKNNMDKTQQKQKTLKKYTIELTEEQIAIVKASLHYALLCEMHGYTCKRMITGSSVRPTEYACKLDEIYDVLNKTTKKIAVYATEGLSIGALRSIFNRDYKYEKRRWKDFLMEYEKDEILKSSIEEIIEKKYIFDLDKDRSKQISRTILDLYKKELKKFRIDY